jgi:hypothetical protein
MSRALVDVLLLQYQHSTYIHVLLCNTMALEDLMGTLQQLLCDQAVEACHDNTKLPAWLSSDSPYILCCLCGD